ncbi:MAG: ABC transporter ATP-binding protein [Roseburia sp.]
MSKEKKEKKKEEKPYHKSHGLFSNIWFIWRNMVAADRHFLVLIPVGMLCAPLMQYLWTFISKFVIDAITQRQDWHRLLVLMLAFTLVQIVFTMLNTYYYSNTWWRYIYTRFCMIREKNLKVMRIDYEHLENTDVMDCYQKAEEATNNNTEGIEGMMREIANFLTSLSVVAVGLIILGTLNLWMVLFLLAVAVLNFLFRDHTNRIAKKRVWDPLATWWRKDWYMRETTTDFAAAKDIRMFGLKDWICRKYQELMDTRYGAQKENERLWRNAGFVGAATWLLSEAAVYAYLIYSVISGSVTIGNFTMYVASFASFSTYISQTLQSVSNLLARSREVDDFRSFLELKAGDETEGGISVPPMEQYEFTFRNVSFRYPKSEKYALKDLNLTVKAGERLAVVGLNGAGKSTFIKLLLRLYEPTEGEILLNGVNVREYNKHAYYKLFAPVFQTVELFAFPLAENVSMQAPDRTEAERAENCLKDAGLAEKLKELPQGVHTEILKVIHDDGVDFSGGEKQKLALARALYKDAPVVILDEPTAALDALAESRLYEDFDKLIGGKTAVYISHRLSSTQFCSHVAMFMDGRLVEYGTHKSLLEQDGEYAKMFRIQAQYYVEGSEVEADA